MLFRSVKESVSNPARITQKNKALINKCFIFGPYLIKDSLMPKEDKLCIQLKKLFLCIKQSICQGYSTDFYCQYLAALIILSGISVLSIL